MESTERNFLELPENLKYPLNYEKSDSLYSQNFMWSEKRYENIIPILCKWHRECTNIFVAEKITVKKAVNYCFEMIFDESYLQSKFIINTGNVAQFLRELYLCQSAETGPTLSVAVFELQ